MAVTPRNYWMIAVSPGYFGMLEEGGFGVVGLSRTHKKRAQRMERGDRILVFIARDLVFAAALTVAGACYEEDTPLFPPEPRGETYPWRVPVKADAALGLQERLDARLLAPRMEYVRKWTAERWPLAFQGLLHLVPKADFLMLEAEMRRAKRGHKPERSAPRPSAADEAFACELDRMAAGAA
ncbi:MAG: EVE domain-containing protein [Dehalococcoidia bacterium]|nr:EVE domain-containing protein [Dehalococcoidia bacterium]